MIPVSLRHEDSEILEANCTITKDYQIISGDESFYRMMGENTMFLMNKLIYVHTVINGAVENESRLRNTAQVKS